MADDAAVAGDDGQAVSRRIRTYLAGTYAAGYVERASTRPDLWGFVLVAIGSALVFLLSADPNPSRLDYFNRLAAAFLQGRVWIDEAPSWLSELIPAGPGQWYVPYPPMPAVLALPFVAVMGPGFPSPVYSCIYAGLAAGFVYLVFGRLGLRVRDRLALSAVFSFGTALWFTSTTGSAWYVAHVGAVLFMAAALLLALDRRPAWAVGLLLGFAALSRLPVALAAPFYLGALLGFPTSWRTLDRGRALRVTLSFAAGAAVTAAIWVAYSWVRYGVLIDPSYVRIPKVLEDPIYAEHGLLSVWYIPRNLYAILFRSWNYVDDPPWFQPSWWGLGIFLTTPLYLWLLKARLRDPRVLWAIPAIALVLVPILTHGNVGISQFGYRFSLDVQLLLFVILATVIASRGWTRLSAAAAVASILICAYAVWAIGIGFVAY